MLPCDYLYWQNRIIIIQKLVLHNKNISKLQAYYPRFQGMTLMYGTQHVIMIKALCTCMMIHLDNYYIPRQTCLLAVVSSWLILVLTWCNSEFFTFNCSSHSASSWSFTSKDVTWGRDPNRRIHTCTCMIHAYYVHHACKNFKLRHFLKFV